MSRKFISVNFFVILSIVAIENAFADIYKCTLPDGRVEYQSIPCNSGSQRAIDDSQAKAKQKEEERKKSLESDIKRSNELWKIEKAAKAEIQEKEDKEDLRALRDCLRSKECTSYTYSSLLKNKHQYFIEDALGEPSSVQQLTGNTLHYYTVPTSDGGRRARLQIVYKSMLAADVNVYN